MAFDLEKYAELYGKFGDSDIQRMLRRAAFVSRERGRSESISLDPVAFDEQAERLVRELEHRRELQRRVVDFFTREAHPWSYKTLDQLALPYHAEIGKGLAHEELVANLLLPAHTRRTTDKEERKLLKESEGIEPKIKASYNRILLTCIQGGLAHVGDLRNVVNLNGEVHMRPMTPQTLQFLQVAL